MRGFLADYFSEAGINYKFFSAELAKERNEARALEEASEDSADESEEEEREEEEGEGSEVEESELAAKTATMGLQKEHEVGA